MRTPSHPRLRPVDVLDAPPGQASDNEPPTLLTLLGVLRRRWLWVLQGFIIVLLLVAILTLRQEPQYTATAGLLFRDSAAALLEDTSGGSFEDPSRKAATNDDLVALPAIAGLTAQRFNGRPETGTMTAPEVAEMVSVSPSDQSNFVEIEARHPDAYVAAAVANDYGTSYIEFRRNADRQQLQEAVVLLEERLASLPPEELSGATAQELKGRLDDLRLAQGLQTGEAELVQRASVPSEPSSPDVRRNLVLGLLLGGIAGLGAGLLRDRIDQSVRSVEEIEEIYGLPVLARIPRSRKLGRGAGHIEDPQAAEGFRTLRANLRFFDVDGLLRSLLISSPVSGDGKSTVAQGLARTMAAMGDLVVLVDADLHKGPQPGADETAPGLSSVLSGSTLAEAFVHEPVGQDRDGARQRELVILPSGPMPPNPLELLESDRMTSVLSQLEERFEYVIIDSPALTVLNDARPLVTQVSGVVVVTGLEHTSRAAATDFRKQLDLMRANALGLVANLTPTQRSGYYYAS